MAESISNTIDEWHELEAAIWTSIPVLGKNWLGKWVSSSTGLKIIVTDGVSVWGENQNACYMTKRAVEWAICIEGDIENLSKEILNQLKNKSSIITCTQDSASLLMIELSASLEGLPYKWIFNLKPLSPNVARRHWIFPIISYMKFMESCVQDLRTELKRRERQLKEIDSNYIPASDSLDSNQHLMTTSAEYVLNAGLGNAICENPCFSPEMITAFNEAEKSHKTENKTVCQDSSTELNSRVKCIKNSKTLDESATNNATSSNHKRPGKADATTIFSDPKKKQKRKICI